MSSPPVENGSSSYSPALTPSRPPLASSPIPETPQMSARQHAPPKSLRFFIAPPSLPSAQKKQYKPSTETSLKSEMEMKVDEVIGEYQEGERLYYFARFDGGIAHKFLARPFMEQYAPLVQEYRQKKKEGRLRPFDPSAAYIHPLSRVKMTISISQNRAKVNISSARSVGSPEFVPDSEEERENAEKGGRHLGGQEEEEKEEEEEQEEEGEEVDDGDDESDGYAESTKELPARATRQSKAKKALPFSPKKTRSQKIITVQDFDSETESSIKETLRTRRSTRMRKPVEIKLDSEYSDSIEDEESDGYGSRSRRNPKSKPLKKRAAHPKFPLPSYGNIREVAALQYDPYSSDEENTPLRNHRKICEKCHLGPAHQLLQAFAKKSKNKGKKRKRSSDDDLEESDEEERLRSLGGWVRCLKCPVAAHWQCLSRTQQDEILKAARAQDRQDWESTGQDTASLQRRILLAVDQTTEFICGACNRGGICMGCMETLLTPHSADSKNSTAQYPKDANGDVVMEDAENPSSTSEIVRFSPSHELLFRCFTCKRLAHYAHLVTPHSLSPAASIAQVADHYQTTKSWLCHDCASYRYPLDKIIAWRPYPPNAVEPPRALDEPPQYKEPLPREYLVKWTGRSYRRLSWVPHMWLLSTNLAKLKHFLNGGTKVELLKEVPEQDLETTAREESSVPFEIGAESRAPSSKPGSVTPHRPLDAMPDAERRILPAWKTVERVLDVLLWAPRSLQKLAKHSSERSNKRKTAIISDNESDIGEGSLMEERSVTQASGEEPPANLTMTLAEWERSTGRPLSIGDINEIAWAFIKWDELGYDEATWDAPPRTHETGYVAFSSAFKRFHLSRNVVVPKLSKAHIAEFDNRAIDGYRRYLLKDPANLDLGQEPNLKLMPFQVDGFNWLCNNWWKHQPCILADDMGLGKTVQVATFLGTIASRWNAFPALVVVPNSTITNWVREFERWAPKLRVVPFYGEKKARDVIKEFELFHKVTLPGNTNAKFHVLITTYEALINPKDFGSVFKHQQRWEVLVIDEGQRLKSDNSLLFKKLNELSSSHRVIMTGTPLNNNMRELFNLMNFLDPVEWHDLEALEKQHDVLDEDLIKQLHNRLRPYFLRRIKSEVLQLPPKNEVIVPVSMAPLQREVYRSILSHNIDLLKGLTQPSKGNNSGTKGRLNNILMHIRKCLQHPYLYSEDIEPRGLPPQETHEKLIDASAKLRFLKVLLPKLKARGHRVLLFSQFVIALNVIEDFLVGEGYKHLRLDGNTKGSDRQKSMDEYNKPGSEYFIFLLTTRAGGVGINLFTADTVIIFDPDFNPHQDLQAIARAYRYGQQKTCLVFKMMVKDSAEERIMQIGKKKLVLDHLIVQKMDEDEDSPGENFQSILTYGAQSLFESDQAAKDIIYSDHDIDKLIEKTEIEGDQTDAPKEGGLTFSFAKIWAADKDSLDDVPDDDQVDSWAQTLQKINTERDKELEHEEAQSGRGARRRAADVAKSKLYVEPPGMEAIPKGKGKGKSKSSGAMSDSSVYHQSDRNSENHSSSSSSGEAEDGDFQMDIDKSRRKSKSKTTNALNVVNGVHGDVPGGRSTAVKDPVDYVNCGLCGGRHGVKQCPMTDNSQNLAEYREMLIMHADDEPWEERSAAIRAIDELLNMRGKLHLIVGQPLHPLPKTYSVPPTKRPKQQEQMGQMSQAQGVAPAVPSSAAPVPVVHGANMSSNAVAGPSRPPQGSNGASYLNSKSGIPSLGRATVASSSSSGIKKTKDKTEKSVGNASSGRCVLCGAVPIHLLKACPLVLEGPKRVSQLISQLEVENDANKRDTIKILKKILGRQKRKEEADAAAVMNG